MMDATLGTQIQVSTLDGTEKLKIEGGTQPNTILKIKGQGLPKLHSSKRGDQFVRVVVEIPKKLSKQQKNLLKDFDGYN
jgi:molecular chaperone DnaJ